MVSHMFRNHRKHAWIVRAQKCVRASPIIALVSLKRLIAPPTPLEFRLSVDEVDSMKNRAIASTLTILIVTIGFFVARALPPSTMCTFKACFAPETGKEISCNSCQVSQTVFTIGVFHISKSCGATEIIRKTPDGNQETRIAVKEKSCQLLWYAFGPPL